MASLKQLIENLKRPNNHVCKPHIFDISKDKDSLAFEQLLQANTDIEVCDDIASQIRELAKIRHPKEKLTGVQLQAYYEEWASNNDVFRYGLWVYYPWNRKLIHILTKEEFIELRTSRNQYKITKEEQEELSKKIVGVVGLSVGQSVSVTMAIERVFGTIRIADFDTLELTNLNRIRRGISDLDLKKTVVVAREIAEIDPFLNVEIYDEGLQEHNIDDFFTKNGKLDVLIEECDSLNIKVLARLKAKSLGIPVIMDTSDRGMLDIERFDLEPNRPIFHGLVAEETLKNLKDLSTEEKIPHILKMTGGENLSKRFKASMLEVDQSITTWPQLATSVTMGGAMAGDLCRRILLDQLHVSGRYYVDMEELIADESNEDAFKIDIPEAVTLDVIASDYEYFKIERPKEAVSVKDYINTIVEMACWAPSGGNVQPWKWYYKNDVLYLFHDKSKSYSFLDYADRGSLVAFGAAVENINQYVAALGLGAKVFFKPNNYKSIIAALVFVKQTKILPHNHLGEYIKQRLTNRKFGKPEEKIEHIKLEEMQAWVSNEPGFGLKIVEEEKERKILSTIIAKAERLRLLDAWGHHDFINEARWTPEEAIATKDGVDLATMEMTASDKAGMSLLKDTKAISYLRAWDKGSGFIQMTQKAPLKSSALALIYAEEDSEVAVFKGGQILERLWLYTTKHGIALQPVSPSTFMFYRLKLKDAKADDNLMRELEILRKEFVNLFNFKGNENEIFLFRMFYADEPTVKSLRYSIDDVLKVD